MSDNFHLIHAQGKLIAAQGEEIAALKARVETIEQAIARFLPQPAPTPSRSSDHLLDNMLTRSSGEIVQRMAEAVPTSTLKDIVSDNSGRR
jgi:hypothetical protein